jgi:uncharacterized protein
MENDINYNSLMKCGNLVTFRKGDRLIVFSGNSPKPLYVPYGSQHVVDAIESFNRPQNGLIGSTEFFADTDLVKILLEYGILTDQSHPPEEQTLGQRQIQEYEESFTTSGNFPSRGFSTLHLYLLLTQFCNQKCIYCLNGELSYNTSKRLRMKEEIAFKSIDFFSSMIQQGGKLNLVFFGGEPLLNWQLAKKIILYTRTRMAKSHPDIEYTYHLTTNLTLFPGDLIEWAKKYRISFLVDVDGPKDIHELTRPMIAGPGSYERTVANLGRLFDEGIKYELRATITSFNQDRISEIAQLHKELRGESCALVPVNPVTSDECILPDKLLPSPARVAAAIAELIETGIWGWRELFYAWQCGDRILNGSSGQWPCGALYGSVPVVNVEGDIYPCIYVVGMPRFKIGNVTGNETNYPDPEVISRMRRAVALELTDHCGGCSMGSVCGHGCPVGPFLLFDNPLAQRSAKQYFRTTTCALQHSLTEAVLWKLGEESWPVDPTRSSADGRTCG